MQRIDQAPPKKQIPAFAVTNFKPFAKGSLVGFFDVEFPSGLILRECSLYSKDGKRWVNPPSRKFTGKDGETRYQRMVDFVSAKAANQFRDAAIAAIDAQQAKPEPASMPPPWPPSSTTISDQDIPF